MLMGLELITISYASKPIFSSWGAEHNSRNVLGRWNMDTPSSQLMISCFLNYILSTQLVNKLSRKYKIICAWFSEFPETVTASVTMHYLVMIQFSLLLLCIYIPAVVGYSTAQVPTSCTSLLHVACIGQSICCTVGGACCPNNTCCAPGQNCVAVGSTYQCCSILVDCPAPAQPSVRLAIW